MLCAAKRLWKTIALVGFLAIMVGGSSAARATDVRFVGSVGYSHVLTSVLLAADEIKNFSASASGPLRMELWGTAAPFAGSFAGGYQLAVYPLGPLAAGASLTNVSSGILPFTSPPGGKWYVSLVVTEQTGAPTNGGYSSDYYLNFPGQISGTGPPPSDTTPPTVSISAPTSGNVSGTVTVSANASDNVGVARVDFYVNGALVGSHSATPYQQSWNTASLANGAATLRAIAFDAAGNSTQSAMVTVNVANGGAGLPPVLQSAVSRKVHGGAGTFDLPLSLVSTNPTTEPRQGPAQTIAIIFDKAITGANVAVTEGTATAGVPTFNGNQVVVPLTGVTDQQYVTVSLTNVASSDGGTNGTGSVRIGFLVGDVNNTRVVTVADVGTVNAQLAQPVTVANFLNDVNATGTITIADKSITSAKLTRMLPAP